MDHPGLQAILTFRFEYAPEYDFTCYFVRRSDCLRFRLSSGETSPGRDHQRSGVRTRTNVIRPSLSGVSPQTKTSSSLRREISLAAGDDFARRCIVKFIVECPYLWVTHRFYIKLLSQLFEKHGLPHPKDELRSSGRSLLLSRSLAQSNRASREFVRSCARRGGPCGPET